MPGRDLTFRAHIERRRPVVYDVDDADDLLEGHRRFMRALNIQTLLGVPLMIGDEIVGCFTLRFPDRRVFSDEDLELAQAVAHHAALALRLVNLGEVARKTAVASERTRLACDLHDTLAQGFSAIHMHLQAIVAEEPESVTHHLDIACELARHNLEVARRSVRSLRPLELSEGSLAGALSALAERTRNEMSVAVDFRLSASPSSLGNQVEDELFRIAQEAITNSVRHAKARSIQVELLCTAREAVTMTIRDDGCGFDSRLVPARPESASGGGFGMTSMGERAQRIGALLTVASEPGMGTEVTVAWRKR